MQGFVGGGVIPDDLHGSSYDGFIHAADWYTTFASLAGATVTNTGPMPVDGVDVSGALLNNKTSPRKEVVLQIISNSTGNLHAHPPADYCAKIEGTDAHQHCMPPLDGVFRGEKPTTVADGGEGEGVGIKCGVLIQGNYKLIWGYPGWTNKAWNGWIKPPSFAANDSGDDAAIHRRSNPCSLDAPCLFDIVTDPNEHENIASLHGDVVHSMQSRVLELLKSEITLESSGLCPTSMGTKHDPRMTEKARGLGFWVPWL